MADEKRASNRNFSHSHSSCVPGRREDKSVWVVLFFFPRKSFKRCSRLSCVARRNANYALYYKKCIWLEKKRDSLSIQMQKWCDL